MNEKKIIEQYREHPDRCPWCRSKKIISVGDIRDNIEPMRCNNCKQQWGAIRGISGIAVDGFTFMFNDWDVKHTRTMNLSWWEICRQDGGTLFCANCKDDYHSLYCLDISPEEAANNSDALCWDCAGVHYHFPLNQIIEIPQVWV